MILFYNTISIGLTSSFAIFLATFLDRQESDIEKTATFMDVLYNTSMQFLCPSQTLLIRKICFSFST